MLFVDIARASSAVAQTSSRREKVERLAEALDSAEPHEVAIVVFYLAGELRQRRTGLGYAALAHLPEPTSGVPELEVTEVDDTFEWIASRSGPGSAGQRRSELEALAARATALEQRVLGGLVTGELRQGALEGVMVDALVRATGLPDPDIRRAVMLAGSIAPVAEAALAEGAAGLERFRLRVSHPVRPMLAATAPDVSAALDRVPRSALEWKLDGVRVQLHRDGDRVWVFTRTLEEVTERLPDVVDTVRAMPAHSVILDAEVVALDEQGRPRPFQVTASRTSSRADVDRLRVSVPLTVFVFDALHLDGHDLLTRGSDRRWAAVERVVPAALRVPHIVAEDVDEARGFFADALARGHEGVVVKSREATYEAGRRGSAWIKVKPRHTLDLVVLAAEWGHGRRTGTLSNLHLGARDPATGRFAMLGKTFKGLTDQMLAWQTERLLALEERRAGWTVYVRPELVVEVAFDGVQTSPRYPAGMALRFARVLGYRPDKSVTEVDSIEAVRAIHGGVGEGASEAS